jgi:hypothetical protein
MRNAWSEPKGRRVLTQPAGAACWRSVLAQRAGARRSRPSAFGMTTVTICHAEERMGDSRLSPLQTSDEESL